MNILGLIRVVMMAVVGISTVFVSAAHSVSDLVPHRALYTVSLEKGIANSAVSSADGIMSVAMEKTCDGWIYTQELKTVIQPVEGNSIQQVAFFTSWESLDGLEYTFASRSVQNGNFSELRGTASLEADGSGGRARFSKPISQEVDLPKGTMFPVSHTVRLLDEMRSGARFFSRIVFSGSDDLQPELINAFIGDAILPTEHDTGKLGNLGDRTGWPLSLAFFPLASDTGIPSFELQVLQLDNGISSNMLMDFGDFATDITAQKIEPLDWPRC
jgi:hypothetical protein